VKSIVTGGAGFIGSNLVSTLFNTEHVEIIDNLSTGHLKFLESILPKPLIHDLDLSKNCVRELEKVFSGADRVFHLAANADVRGGWRNSLRDIEQNIMATYHVAEAARLAGVKEVVFASTGCVYGDAVTIPTPETEKFPIQTSLYGMSKTAAEGILSSYAAQGAFDVSVFRFVSVLGRNYHHGHVIDFVRKLRGFSGELDVLGNGKQNKSYINVSDCVEALIGLRSQRNFEVFNIGHTYSIPVSQSAMIIASAMNLKPIYNFGTEPRGWIGDSPNTFLDTTKAKNFGWEPKISIEESINETVDFLLKNPWVLDKMDYRDSR
jgi:UDP-glucose 4-epimerase